MRFIDVCVALLNPSSEFIITELFFITSSSGVELAIPDSMVKIAKSFSRLSSMLERREFFTRSGHENDRSDEQLLTGITGSYVLAHFVHIERFFFPRRDIFFEMLPTSAWNIERVYWRLILIESAIQALEKSFVLAEVRSHSPFPHGPLIDFAYAFNLIEPCKIETV